MFLLSIFKLYRVRKSLVSTILVQIVNWVLVTLLFQSVRSLERTDVNRVRYDRYDFLSILRPIKDKMIIIK